MKLLKDPVSIAGYTYKDPKTMESLLRPVLTLVYRYRTPLFLTLGSTMVFAIFVRYSTPSVYWNALLFQVPTAVTIKVLEDRERHKSLLKHRHAVSEVESNFEDRLAQAVRDSDQANQRFLDAQTEIQRLKDSNGQKTVQIRETLQVHQQTLEQTRQSYEAVLADLRNQLEVEREHSRTLTGQIMTSGTQQAQAVSQVRAELKADYERQVEIIRSHHQSEVDRLNREISGLRSRLAELETHETQKATEALDVLSAAINTVKARRSA